MEIDSRKSVSGKDCLIIRQPLGGVIQLLCLLIFVLDFVAIIVSISLLIS